MLSLAQRTTYSILLLSLYVVPLPFGQEGADATSSVARVAVGFEIGCAGPPAAEVTAVFTSRVSLLAVLPVIAVEEVESLEVESLLAIDVLFEDVPTDSLLSGQTTLGSHAFFEQQPLKPVDWQA